MHDASEQQQVAKGAASTKSSILQAEASSLQQQLQHAEGTAHQRRSELQQLQQALSSVQQQLQQAREQLVAAATERDLLKQVLQVSASGRDWSEHHVCATAVMLATLQYSAAQLFLGLHAYSA
jgi:chromosome segregation ATPase